MPSLRAFFPLAKVLENRPKRGFLNGNLVDSCGNPDSSWLFFHVVVGRGFLFMVLVDHIFMFSAVFDRHLQTREAQLSSKNMFIFSVTTILTAFRNYYASLFTNDTKKSITAIIKISCKLPSSSTQPSIWKARFWLCRAVY